MLNNWDLFKRWKEKRLTKVGASTIDDSFKPICKQVEGKLTKICEPIINNNTTISAGEERDDH